MKTSEVLKAAREKISVPERWTQNTSARDVNSLPELYTSPNAVSWCALGSLWSIESGDDRQVMTLLNSIVPNVVGDENSKLPVEEFNDTHTHPEVLAMFDRAIELAEQQEAA